MARGTARTPGEKLRAALDSDGIGTTALGKLMADRLGGNWKAHQEALQRAMTGQRSLTRPRAEVVADVFGGHPDDWMDPAPTLRALGRTVTAHQEALDRLTRRLREVEQRVSQLEGQAPRAPR